ncbi:MAG: protein adenylyltransferase SelO [Ferrovibrionaceae bacterium]
MTLHFPFDNSYARLPDRFFARLAPTPVAEPRLIRVNHALAVRLGLDPAALESPEGVAVLAGNAVPAGAEVLAMAYAGHQFGNFVPQLGDGRALLLGEVVGSDGQRYALPLTGSGPTPLSRRGDGRAALGPVLREYLVSEAMAALGIPTTRALAAVTTGDTVFRDRPLPGAVIARVATSFVRVGTFQYFAARGDVEGIRLLADHVIARNYPDLAGAPYRALLDAVVAGQAELVARWLLVGFVHGVMNTDNMSIACETIDYGPCAFMDGYDPGMVLSSIDHGGRYAYGNQPRIAQWNLARLAECLLPLLADAEDAQLAEAQAALDGFAPRFEAAYHRGLRAKFGLETAEDDDLALARDLMQAMAAQGADFTLTFRRLADAVTPEGEWRLRALFAEPEAVDAWLPRWRARLAREDGDRAAALRSVNPAFIPRNHRIEEAIAAAIELGDFSPFATLHEVLARPFDDQPGREAYAEPPQDFERVTATFCGT